MQYIQGTYIHRLSYTADCKNSKYCIKDLKKRRYKRQHGSDDY